MTTHFSELNYNSMAWKSVKLHHSDKKKKSLSRINSFKWRNNPTCSRLITDLRCSATQVVYECLFDTQTHFLLKRDSLTVVKIRSAVKAHFVFFLHPRENSTTWTDPHGITLFFQKYPACHRSLSLV